MPHKDRSDSMTQDVEEKPSERRQRLKSERDPDRPRKTRSSRPKVIDPETGEAVRVPHRRKRDKENQTSSEPNNNSMADIVPELARVASTPGMTSRSSLPYPTFSKAHSKEAVNIKDESVTTAPSPRSQPKTSPYTPDSTDLGSESKSKSKSRESLKTTRSQTHKNQRPPSPPDTEFSEQKDTKDKKGIPTRTPSRTSQIIKEEEGEKTRPASASSQRSWFGRPKVEIVESSKLSTRSKQSKASTAVKSHPKPAPAAVEIVEDDDDSDESEAGAASAIDSNATSVAPPRTQSAAPKVRPPGLEADDSPESNQESSPRTPTATPQFPHYFPKPTPSPFVSFDLPETQSSAFGSPMPPPPPPPPMVPMSVPRVDYLLQNGGLLRPVPRTLMAATPAYASQTHHAMKTPAPPEIEKVFGPFYSLLDQYETVIKKNGSVAVATGYRSVARRLLDRLENVFARELPSAGCTCVMCRESDRTDITAPGWGDILEAVSGRREIPAWPAADFGEQKEGTGLGISGQRVGPARPGSPVKIDPDIAEEFHQHYLRQSKKTKASVDKWLNSTPGAISAPPPDVDDETLTFTILTHLEPHDRPIFNALIAGSSQPVESMSRAPTPNDANGKPRADLIVRSAIALQRLYRLPEPPRDPEICVYLLKNQESHPLLLSLSEINNPEWEILVSGRFDGFLWSGAEAEFPGSMLNSPSVSRLPTPAQGLASRGPTPGGLPSRGPTPAGRHPSLSRMNTPFSGVGGISRGPTPSQFAPTSMPPTPFGQNRQAVSNDEETEIATLAELEREIYAGMEALEDAFEGLHRKAERVRSALRERGAGLSMMAQNRRGSGADGIYARLGTPGFGERGWEGGESEVDAESDWGGDDTVSELAPDDSASNISSSRHRRPKRRTERRTPAPVEEEDEN